MKKINQSIYKAGSFILGMMLLLSVSCKKENRIVDNNEDRRMYKLPQGNQPYDQQIVDLYNKYNTVILYNFTDVDFKYNFTGPIEVNLWATPAGPNGIQQTLDFFQEHWFSLYPDTFLVKHLPFKILLASEIRKKREWSSEDTIQLAANAGYKSVAFGLTGKLDNLSNERVDSVRGEIHGAFWQQALFNGTIPMPPAFPILSGYTTEAVSMRNAGIFSYRTPMGPLFDLADHIKVITSHHKSWLDANLFTPQNDPMGNFKKKYNIIINYYKTNYNIDLQQIGNL